MNLSKSRYCSGIQCPKMLWMKKNMPEAFDESVMNEAVLATGTRVGEVARGYFGEFTEVPYSETKSEMIRDTKALLDAGAKIITEASFATGGHFCSTDILINHGDSVDIVEVKSSTDIKEINYHDMAFQYYVVSRCGLKVGKIYLMHLNSDYERHGDLDLEELFVLNDCTAEVVPMQADVEDNIRYIVSVADRAGEPDNDIGEFCLSPYECGYRGHCWRHIPEHSVFTVSKLRTSKKFDAYRNGIIAFPDLLESGMSLNAKQITQIRVEVSEAPPIVEKAAIGAFLETLSYPLYFLDFETFQQAIPEYDGIRPYAQIPFQFSLHILDKPGGTLTHKEFLAKEGVDPRPELAKRLCEDIPENVCVLAYNMGFEKGVIARLAENHPEYKAHLMSIHENIRDLMRPFADHAYYQRELRGKYSIKAVLPALCGGDPELDYDALDCIHNGSEAMAAFPALPGMPAAEIAEFRAALLAYCRLDTLAMVKILEQLYAMAQ